jgi:hypothetical protein
MAVKIEPSCSILGPTVSDAPSDGSALSKEAESGGKDDPDALIERPRRSEASGVARGEQGGPE